MTAVADESVPRTAIPRIVSVDDHVVEPAHLWQTWLPERFRDAGPKVERRGIGTMRHIGGGTYEQTFDPDGPQADCWVYEDLVYINKRHVAAVGFDRDDMTMSPITYDEMRPGCYDPKARVADMEMNHVEASLCFPSFPRTRTPRRRRDPWPRGRSGRRNAGTTGWSTNGAAIATARWCR